MSTSGEGTTFRSLCKLTHEIFLGTEIDFINHIARYVPGDPEHGGQSVDSNRVVALPLAFSEI